jgi:hypothetical protein
MSDPKVQRVIDAWKIPGPVPAMHAEAQRRLRREWPALAQAIEALAAERVKPRA